MMAEYLATRMHSTVGANDDRVIGAARDGSRVRTVECRDTKRFILAGDKLALAGEMYMRNCASLRNL